MRLFFISLCLFGFAARADWAFKSFAARKAQIADTQIAADRPMLLLVDQKCRAQAIRVNKNNLDPIAALGFEAKHNSFPADLRYAAIDVHSKLAFSRADLENRLQNEACVIGLAENPVVRTAGFNDPLADQQVALGVIQQAGGERYFFHPLWGIRQNVTVAVVDSGTQLDHPDLRNQLWSQDGAFGFDFANNDADPSDDFGHGTHVAGIIAAQADNGIGIRGVMGNYARIMSVKSQDATGSGTMATMINAFRWAVDHGAEVVNLSLSSRLANQALADALDYALSKNVTVVTAAGNDGEEITATNFFSPAGYAPTRGGVISVGSIDTNTLNRSNFSNYGPSFVEVSAPGSPGSSAGILSTYINGRYIGINGTSMSAPHVAGAAALVTGFLKTRGVTFTPAQVETLIENAADPTTANAAYFQNGRALNLENLGRYLFNTTINDSTGGFDD